MSMHSLLEKAFEKGQQALEKGQAVAAVALDKGREYSAAAAQAAQDLAAGNRSVIVDGKNYQLTGLIAEGGFAYVYRARDPQTAERFAIKKVLAQDKEATTIAKYELDFLRTLPEHPNIIRFFGGCKQPASNGAGDEYLFVLELCAGGALTKHVKPGARWLKESAVLAKFVDTCKGVAHMHSQRPPIAHRDLKLENVLEGAKGVCKLCDFGSATTRVLDCASASRRERLDEEDLIGRYTTPWNRAPEMLDMHRGQRIDAAVDVWALGCLLFSLAYRRHPFDSESPLQILNCNYSIPEGARYSAELANLVIAMLEPDPARRPSVFEATERAALLYAEAMAGDLTPQEYDADGYDAMGGAAPDGFADDGAAEAQRTPPPPLAAAESRRAESFERRMADGPPPAALGGSPLAGRRATAAPAAAPAATPPPPPPDLLGLGEAPAPPPAPAAEGWAAFDAFGDAAPAAPTMAPTDLGALLGAAPAAPAAGGAGGAGSGSGSGGAGSFWATFGAAAAAEPAEGPSAPSPPSPQLPPAAPAPAPAADAAPPASASAGAGSFWAAFDAPGGDAAAPPAPPPQPPSPPSPAAPPAAPPALLDDFGSFSGAAVPAASTAPAAASLDDAFACFGSAPAAPAASLDDGFGCFAGGPAAAPAATPPELAALGAPTPPPPAAAPPAASVAGMAGVGELAGGGAETAAAAAAAAAGGGGAGAAPPEFGLGAAVTVHGLQAKPEHNGKPASVLGWDAAKGRYNVSLSGSGVVLALKPANLAPARAAPPPASPQPGAAPAAGGGAACGLDGLAGLDGLGGLGGGAAGAAPSLDDAFGCFSGMAPAPAPAPVDLGGLSLGGGGVAAAASAAEPAPPVAAAAATTAAAAAAAAAAHGAGVQNVFGVDAPDAAAAAAAGVSPMALLRPHLLQLKALHDEGLISREEYEHEKAALLASARPSGSESSP